MGIYSRSFSILSCCPHDVVTCRLEPRGPLKSAIEMRAWHVMHFKMVLPPIRLAQDLGEEKTRARPLSRDRALLCLFASCFASLAAPRRAALRRTPAVQHSPSRARLLVLSLSLFCLLSSRFSDQFALLHHSILSVDLIVLSADVIGILRCQIGCEALPGPGPRP